MPSNLISIRDDASFKEFANLKVPNRRDRFSSMKLPALASELGEAASATQQAIEDLWQERNTADIGKTFVFADKVLVDVLRWHLRGLSVNAAVKKVRIGYEVSRNCVPR